MDYKTKATSRNDIRKYAVYFRKIFGVKPTGKFPVLQALDKLKSVFEDCDYIVVEDNELPIRTMARCVPNELGGYTIQIKESVYMGAFERNIGAFRGFIVHELAHVFLFKIGFAPVFERSFENGELPRYCSVEWQAKALAGEVMIPYEESKGLSVKELKRRYGVSKGFAETRKGL